MGWQVEFERGAGERGGVRLVRRWLPNDRPGGHCLLPSDFLEGLRCPEKQVAVCGTSALALGSASHDCVFWAFMRVLSSLPLSLPLQFITVQ